MNDGIISGREKTCCFTGHRDRDLPFGGDRSRRGMKNLISVLHLEIEETVRAGYDTFLCGMAEGIDLICAEIVHQMIAQGYKIKLVCVIPYKGHIRDIKTARDRYVYTMIRRSHPNILISGKFCRECYKCRNRFMVERSSKLIGVYRHKEKGSGTVQTISMARKAGIDMKLINLDRNPVYYMDGE